MKKMQNEYEYLNSEIVLIWSDFSVIATRPSSMYTNSPYCTNNIGHRFSDAGFSILSMECILKSFVGELDICREQMKHLKWYNIERKYDLSNKIASHESDVRLMSLLVERYYERSNDVSAIIEKKRVVKDRMKMLRERKQRIVDELHEYKLSLAFDKCDEMCADADAE